MSEAVSTPEHIGIIMDGNRRWAKQRGLETIEGHRAGYEALKRVAEHALNLGVEEMSVFAFSTENWRRSKEEVDGLLDLFRWVMESQIDELHDKNIRVRIVGSKEGVPEDLLASFDAAEEKTKDNDRGALNVLFNYGGRNDIVEAVRSIVADDNISASDVNEDLLSKHLSTAGMRDLDLLIRTTEHRLSGFLAWESVYAEVYFQPEVTWPDFDAKELDKALEFYANRHRRFGA